MYWPSRAAHHQLHCFSFLATVTVRQRDPPDVIFKVESVAARHTYDNVTAPCPWAGAMIRRKKCSWPIPAAQCSCTGHSSASPGSGSSSIRHHPEIELITSSAPASRPPVMPAAGPALFCAASQFFSLREVCCICAFLFQFRRRCRWRSRPNLSVLLWRSFCS